MALLASCAQGGSAVTPASPEAAVRGFLQAVRDNKLEGMAERWGDQRGPARSYMPASELNQRLTVIRTYLQHERAELLESQTGLPVSDGNQRTIQVRLTRHGCTPVVPFTLMRFRSGWLISNIDIASAGSPARRCAPPSR